MTSIIKLTVNLSSEVVDDVSRLARRRGCTMTEVIRDAIGSAKFIAEQEGATFFIEDKSGTRRRVMFHKEENLT